MPKEEEDGGYKIKDKLVALYRNGNITNISNGIVKSKTYSNDLSLQHYTIEFELLNTQRICSFKHDDILGYSI